MSASSASYFNQLLETATKGNVTVVYAAHADRMQLHCKVCDQQLTAPWQMGTEIDYSVQEFIKMHAHVGGHVGYKKSGLTGGWEKYQPGQVIPLTADFKHVSPVKKPLKISTGRKFR